MTLTTLWFLGALSWLSKHTKCKYAPTIDDCRTLSVRGVLIALDGCHTVQNCQPRGRARQMQKVCNTWVCMLVLP